jgi:hypothetical protein
MILQLDKSFKKKIDKKVKEVKKFYKNPRNKDLIIKVGAGTLAGTVAGSTGYLIGRQIIRKHYPSQNIKNISKNVDNITLKIDENKEQIIDNLNQIGQVAKKINVAGDALYAAGNNVQNVLKWGYDYTSGKLKNLYDYGSITASQYKDSLKDAKQAYNTLVEYYDG